MFQGGWLPADGLIDGAVYNFTSGVTISGPNIIKFANGSATSPSIAFSNDQDTGWYLYGSNSIGYAANGAVRAILASDGSAQFGVGYGTGNVVLGRDNALGSSTYNTISGQSNGSANLTGSHNLVVGQNNCASLSGGTTVLSGNGNIVLGRDNVRTTAAVTQTISGSGNIIAGERILYQSSALTHSGSYNAIFGYNHCSVNAAVTGSYNIVAGYQNRVDNRSRCAIFGAAALANANGGLYISNNEAGNTRTQGIIQVYNRNISTHSDGVWYSLYTTSTNGYFPNSNTVFVCDVYISGLTANAAQQWAYVVRNVAFYKDNAGNFVQLSAGTVTAIAESDANYDVRVNIDGVFLSVQVQRNNPGTDYAIRWGAIMVLCEHSY